MGSVSASAPATSPPLPSRRGSVSAAAPTVSSPLSSPRFLSAGYFRVTSRSPDWTRRARVFVSAMSNEIVPMSAPCEAPATSRNIEGAGSAKQQLSRLVKESLDSLFPDEVQPIVAACQAKFGDYQCNNAMVIWSQLKGKTTQFKNPSSIGQAIAKNLPESEMIESSSVAGPGFVNIKFSNKWISKHIQNMLVNGIEQWAPILSVRKAVVDFSSPNIAKEMHVGHLRSTIMGDTLARMLEFSNVEVLRRNHVGDWGTQFGMLIEYLFEQFPNWEDAGDQAIGDLQAFYKASKKKFDDDPDFKTRAQQAVVKLQSGEDKYRHAWQNICEISRKEFDLVYQRLKVQLEEKGESFYNPYIRGILEEFERNNLIKESEGARVVEIDGYDIPLIVVKKDGGYNYASTDLACLWYRLTEEKAEWIIYITDVGQQQHFDMFFSAARLIGWLPASKDAYPKASHVGLGLVLGSDGKRFRTRSSEVVRLVELLDEAKNRSKAELIKRLEDNGKITDWTDAELESTAEAVGYGAIKYADLKNNRLTNYTFSFDQMLNDKGNTAVYLLYAHARICSIINKSSKDIEEFKKIGKIVLDHVDERALGLHLIQFAEIVEEACSNLLPNVLCEYLYNLSEMFTRFYTSCQVIGSEQQESRLLLCEATAIVMRKCFLLLGITPVYRI
ncbi:arginine--tRNA ligase, cytoplasmic-like isoform X1 [Zingiber officinale]|uniref:arginine--tRNA ligase, cytoplasmic-like isoform X1 n=2 Tax=Zingiber officinale TaxID=94328 RepID=UPI001C4CC13A|nr:arginine--tRNA ligase, cytoplasmic-like isoform X1 [Zingiber officinale]